MNFCIPAVSNKGLVSRPPVPVAVPPPLLVLGVVVPGNGFTVVIFDVLPLNSDLNTVDNVRSAGSSPFSLFSSWMIEFIVL